MSLFVLACLGYPLFGCMGYEQVAYSPESILSRISMLFSNQLTRSIGIVLNTIAATMRTEELLKLSQAPAEQLQKTTRNRPVTISFNSWRGVPIFREPAA